MAVGGADRDAKGMANLVCSEHFVVANQPGKDGEPRGIGRRPAFRTPGIRSQIEDGAGAGLPSSCRRVPARSPGLVEPRPVPLEDEQVPVAVIAPTGYRSFDVVGHCFRLFGDGIARGRSGCSRITLVAEENELHRDERLGLGDSHVRDPERRRPEIRVKRRVTDPLDDVSGAQVGRRLGDCPGSTSCPGYRAGRRSSLRAARRLMKPVRGEVVSYRSE